MKAFEKIFDYFNQCLHISQSDSKIIEGGGVALVVCKLKLWADGLCEAKVSMERKPTYIFRRSVDRKWRCLIDNSYGAELLA